MKKLKLILSASILCICMFSLFGCNNKIYVDSVEFNQEIIYLTVNSTYALESNSMKTNDKLVATASPVAASDRTIVFSVSDTDIITIEGGSIIAHTAGVAVITATSNNITDNCTVKVINTPINISKINEASISFDGSKIIWDKPENADFGYQVKINNDVISQVASNSFADFNSGVENTISIKALGSGTAYVESEWSNDFTFNRLLSPTNLSYTGSEVLAEANTDGEIENNTYYVFSWDETLNATKYNLYNASDVKIADSLTNSVSIKEDMFNDYSLKSLYVVAESNMQNVFTSKPSQKYLIQLLDTPKDIKLAGGIITFSGSTYASGYNLVIDDDYDNVISLDKNTIWEVPSSITAGKHSIKLQNVGNNDSFITSKYTEDYFYFTKLDTVSGLNINENIISWNQVASAYGYIIKINDQLIDLSTTRQYILGDSYVAGDYLVSVSCVGSGTQYVASNFSVEEKITKLLIPNSFTVLNGSIQFSSVENATSYYINVNGEIKVVYDSEKIDGKLNVDLNVSSGNYNIRVQAVGDGVNYVKSQYTNVVNTTKLDLPQTPFLNNGVVSWKDVVDSYGYDVKINNTEYEMHDLASKSGIVSLDMSEDKYISGNYTISVKAISSESNISSDYSEVSNFIKLDTPENFGVYNGDLCWDYDSQAKTYIINRNGEDEDDLEFNELERTSAFEIDKYIHPEIFAQYYSEEIPFSIYSKGDSETYISSSKATTGLFIKPLVQNLAINNDILSFDKEVDSRVLLSYQCDDNDATERVSTALKSFQLPGFNDANLVPGNYKFIIKSQGDTDKYLNGVEQSISTVILDTPSNFRVEDGLIQWEAPKGAFEFTITIYQNDEKIKTINNLSKTSFTFNTFTDFQVDTDYEVSIKASGDGTNSISSPESSEVDKITATILPAPEIKVTEGVLTWGNITYALKYQVVIDNNIPLSAENKLENKLEDGVTQGLHSVKVCAYGDSTKYLTSDYSIPLEIKKLATPSNLYIKSDGVTGEPVLYCDKLEADESVAIYRTLDNAVQDHYIFEDSVEEDFGKVEINLLEFEQLIAANNSSAEIVDKLSAGYYQFSAKSIGDSINQISSNNTATCVTVVMEAPTDLSVIDGELTWGQVTGKVSYELKIKAIETGDTNPVELNATKYALDEDYQSGEYQICVKAVGDQSKFITGEYSDWFDVTKLSIPKNVRVQDGLIAFDTIENVELYNIYLDGQIIGSAGSGTYELPDEIEGGSSYEIMVQALGNDDNLINGEAGINDGETELIGESFTVQKLNVTQEFSLIDGKVGWVPLLNASSYHLVVDNCNTENIEDDDLYEIDVTGKSLYELDNNVTVTSHSIKIKAVGSKNSGNYVNSSYSNVIQFNKLPQVINFRNDNGVMSWNEVDYASGYIVRINIMNGDVIEDTREEVVSFDKTYYELSQDVLASGSDKALDINVRAMGNSTSNIGATYYVNGPTSTTKTFMKLNVPTALMIDDTGKVSWIAGNDGLDISYEININDGESFVQSETTQDLSYELGEEYSSGMYNIRVKAIGKDIENLSYLNSDYSEYISALKPNAPTNVNVVDGVVTWDYVSGIEKYIINYEYKVLNAGNEGFSNVMIVSVSENFWYLGQSGTYKISIKAVGPQGLTSDPTIPLVNGSNEIVFDYFTGGEGTPSEPYEINNYEDLTKVGRFPYASFIQKADITVSRLDDYFIPMFTEGNAYKGIYYGNGKTITGLTITGKYASCGMFGEIDSLGEVRDLTLEDLYINTESYAVGGIAARNYGVISNCKVSGEIIVNATVTNSNIEVIAGGIAGYNEYNPSNNSYALIKNCTIDGLSISSDESNITKTFGGISGWNFGKIYQSRAIGNGVISGNQVGGIVGYNCGKVEECYNDSRVEATNIICDNALIPATVGGVVGINTRSGQNYYIGLVYNCYNIGSVYIEDQQDVVSSLYLSGIVGHNQSSAIAAAKIYNCYNAGEVLYTKNGTSTLFISGITFNDAQGTIEFVHCLSGVTPVSGNDANCVVKVTAKTNIELSSESYVTELNNNLISFNTKIGSPINISNGTGYVYVITEAGTTDEETAVETSEFDIETFTTTGVWINGSTLSSENEYARLAWEV